MSEEPQKINRPPFPPRSLNFSEIVNESLRKYKTGKSSKTPNAYLLYRKEYTATFKSSNLGHISTLSSEAWNSEPHEIKLAYKKYAEQINEIVRKEMPYCFVASKADRSLENSDDDFETVNQSNQMNRNQIIMSNQITRSNTNTNEVTIVVVPHTNYRMKLQNLYWFNRLTSHTIIARIDSSKTFAKDEALWEEYEHE
ncbi:9291_t:CDS:2 [Dentiscutata erythropus]|uniref:9291_t:CDS:1 n=1 Tax=Dentiscutata erythropus TaxID=1348616 RepID=A0A9N9AIK4_9GLOM|nr:9291_t:CDS:2 [Dentiscutata erythropus]